MTSERRSAASSAVSFMLVVFFLSALDAFLTLRGVRGRLFAELNPLAAWLIARSSAAFVVTKMALALGGFWVLATRRSSGVARVLLAAGLTAYAALDAYWLYLLTR